MLEIIVQGECEIKAGNQQRNLRKSTSHVAVFSVVRNILFYG